MVGKTLYYPHFFTATILEWMHLLKADQYKNIIINSLDFLVQNHRVAIYGFVLMSNHIHLEWHIAEGHKRENVQRDFLKFTAQMIKADMERHHPLLLEKFRVNAKDRKYQIWERNPLSVELYSQKVMWQKLNYMHSNPVRAGLCTESWDYKYSSALFYEKGIKDWKFLTHYLG
jgi:putative transposase